MLTTVKLIWEFICLMTADAKGKISCGISIICTIIGIYTDFSNTWQPRYWYITSALAFLVAAFNVWRHEREQKLFVQKWNEPKVAINFNPDIEDYASLISNRGNDYRVLRIKVENTGGEPLYNLKAQLKLTNNNKFFNGDLTLKDDGLPIIRGQVVSNSPIVVKPHTEFTLARGGEKFVNVVMQCLNGSEEGIIKLCLANIKPENYSNNLTINNSPNQYHEFSIIVLGGIYPPYSKLFALFLDNNGSLQMKAIDKNENLSNSHS